MSKLVMWILLIICVSGRLCYAFEVGGFQTGMSMKEALTIARDINASAKVFKSIPGVTHILISDKENTNQEIEWNLIFCHDGLVELTKDYAFNWPKITEIVSRMNKQYGKGYVSPLSSSLSDLSSFGIRGGVSSIGIDISWKNDIEAVSISMKLVKPEGMDIGEAQQSKGKEKISEYYGIFNDGCLGEK